MNTLLRSSMHPPLASARRQGIISSSVIQGRGRSGSGSNTAAHYDFSWQYWCRLQIDQFGCWGQQQPYHSCNQNNEHDVSNLEKYDSSNGEVAIRNNICAPKFYAFSLRPSTPFCLSQWSTWNKMTSPILNGMNVSSVMMLSPLAAESLLLNSIRCMSSNTTTNNKCQDFSTLGVLHSSNQKSSTSSTSNNANKHSKDQSQHSQQITSKQTTEKDDDDDDPDLPPPSELSTPQKIKHLFRKYGFTFVATYGTLYFVTLLSIFLSLDSGLIDPETISNLFDSSREMASQTAETYGPHGSGATVHDAAEAYKHEVATEIDDEKKTVAEVMARYLEKWEWTRKYGERVEENPHLANLVVAWVMVKFTEPVRLGLAVAVVPRVARVLGRKREEKEKKVKGKVKEEREKAMVKDS